MAPPAALIPSTVRAIVPMALANKPESVGYPTSASTTVVSAWYASSGRGRLDQQRLIEPGTRVPHPTTLMKITTRCGEDAVTGLNEALLVKAATAKLLRTDKVRADTTVVEAAGYPTDSGLLAKAIGTMARSVARIKAAGGATRTRARDRRRSAGGRAR